MPLSDPEAFFEEDSYVIEDTSSEAVAMITKIDQPGEYEVQVQLVDPTTRIKSEQSSGHQYRWMNLEVTGGEFAGAQAPGVKVYEEKFQSEHHLGEENLKIKIRITRQNIASIALAAGVQKMTKFDDIAGKIIRITCGYDKKGYFKTLGFHPRDAEKPPFIPSNKPSPAQKVDQDMEDKIKDEIPF